MTRGAVAAGDPREAAAGQWALERGGNALDAVVAAAFVAFVVEPWNCGLGGYGHASVWLPARGEFVTVDHGPRAPLAATTELFAAETDVPSPGYLWPPAPGDRNEHGGLAVATPGAVAGLAELHALGGRLPWADLLEPAIAAASRGLTVSGALELALTRRAAVLDETGARELFPRDATLDRLAGTLRALADGGPDVLTSGDLGAAVVGAVQRAGGVLEARDLAEYTACVRVEEPGVYRDLRYATGDDPVGREVLGILSAFDLGTLGPADRAHLIAEACAAALVDNVAWYGDPDIEDAPVHALGSPEFAASRARGLTLGRAWPRPMVPADPWPWEQRPGNGPASGAGAAAIPGSGLRPSTRGGAPGTSQVSVVDAEGTAVALITTVGGRFGSGVPVPELGFVLNNGMVNFDTRPDSPGRVAPGKRPFFAVPALTGVRADGTVLAAAGSGYYRILSAIVAGVVNVVDRGLSAQEAVRAPRVHGQGGDTYLDGRFPGEVRADLECRGHRVVVESSVPYEPAFARLCLVTRSATGELAAAADPADSTGVTTC